MLVQAMCAISFTRGKSIAKSLNIEQFRLEGNLEEISNINLCRIHKRKQTELIYK